MGLAVLAWGVAYQQVENLTLEPRISARAVDVHPAVAFTSVLLGTSLFGVAGALLAVPVLAMLLALLDLRVTKHELVDRRKVTSRARTPGRRHRPERRHDRGRGRVASPARLARLDGCAADLAQSVHGVGRGRSGRRDRPARASRRSSGGGGGRGRDGWARRGGRCERSARGGGPVRGQGGRRRGGVRARRGRGQRTCRAGGAGHGPGRRVHLGRRGSEPGRRRVRAARHARLRADRVAGGPDPGGLARFGSLGGGWGAPGNGCRSAGHRCRCGDPRTLLRVVHARPDPAQPRGGRCGGR